MEHLSIEGHIKKYGFCNWQAQEVIKERDALVRVLQDARALIELPSGHVMGDFAAMLVAIDEVLPKA